jgi:hypothetical protein
MSLATLNEFSLDRAVTQLTWMCSNSDKLAGDTVRITSVDQMANVFELREKEVFVWIKAV